MQSCQKSTICTITDLKIENTYKNDYIHFFLDEYVGVEHIKRSQNIYIQYQDPENMKMVREKVGEK